MKGDYRSEEEQYELENKIEKVNRGTSASIEVHGRQWSEQLQEELTR